MLGDSKLMSSAAWDAQSLNELKISAGKDPQANVKPVARQVEGMFVQMMLKSMRDALPKDGLFSSDQSRLYTSMYDQQIAQQMTAGKGLGLADEMVKQMTANQDGPKELPAQVPLKFDLETVTRYQNSALTQMVHKALPKTPSASDAADVPGDSHDFLAQLSLPAKLASEQSGIPHHLILAQAALESGWGQRQIRRENGEPSFNLFGVKASADWKGKVTEITTSEYENGEMKKVKARFRVYASYLEALSDYVGLLTRNPRYAAVTSASTPEQGAQALQKAGYATDPNYARKLTGMIQQLKSMSEKVGKAYGNDIENLF
ncbi:flagellar assembly peptidoglycan hydrolase FlgJ [Scandinavium manionii]|uniref:flagellar assembly peptidoglycan hydrolase FlgJ n=1 Tax=Scandinavium manionii TaxID=2926520 RepID=UPI001358A988|nr:flagellar assembly peptidoglycan hydrolase FlgJ [Scandinavium manionii]MCS2147857.1 flagellar assembly peptidoglycan hydrolase FlgJ [Scandinavium manionii]